jgi:hypothetical protein
MTEATRPSINALDTSRAEDQVMATDATSLAGDPRRDDWTEPRYDGAGQSWTRTEWLWTLFGLALLVTFLLFLVDDYPLRNLIAGR